jgi:hypothetical protein
VFVAGVIISIAGGAALVGAMLNVAARRIGCGGPCGEDGSGDPVETAAIVGGVAASVVIAAGVAMVVIGSKRATPPRSLPPPNRRSRTPPITPAGALAFDLP